jgi:hypothetical protein
MGVSLVSHPDKNIVGLVGLGMETVAFLGIFVLAVLASMKAGSGSPRRRSRTTYWIGMCVMVPLALATFPLAPKAMQALAVIASFGWDSYAEGLHVVNKHGLLSDGRFLGIFWSAATGVGCIVLDFFWVIPIAAWHYHFNPRQQPRPSVDPMNGARANGTAEPAAASERGGMS